MRFFRPCYWKFRKPFPSKVAVRILFLKNICSTNFNIIIKENLVKTVFPPLCGFPSLRTLISETYKNYTRIIWRFKTPVLTYVLLKLNLRDLVLEHSWKKVYSRTTTKWISLLYSEHGFCQQNGPETVQVQDWKDGGGPRLFKW